MPKLPAVEVDAERLFPEVREGRAEVDSHSLMAQAEHITMRFPCGIILTRDERRGRPAASENEFPPSRPVPCPSSGHEPDRMNGISRSFERFPSLWHFYCISRPR